MIDKEVTVKHVQSLNSRDAVASLFSWLGYDVEDRTEQRPESLGVSADSPKRAITHIENVATQDDWLRVILVEMKSVTVAHTRTLANSLRNLAGDFLLVLTSDYERIDFVLLQRIAPTDGGTMTQKQVKARPRVLTVDRRKPDRVALRVLRRLTYTEADPYAQYDKLLSAFDTAEWSEEHFDNRALFSDYFLTERLREMPEWEENPRPAFRRFQELFERAQSRWAGKTEGKLRDGLLEPALQTLGFRTEVVKAADDNSPRPDYELHCPNTESDTPACLCLTYPWGRSLDGKDPTRDSETPEENPGARVVSLLHGGQVPFAIVTNGKLWRLYSSKTHSMSSRFYQLDVPEILAREDPSEAFRYFWLIFRAKAFEPRTEVVEGEEKETCFAAHLIEQSQEYARRLGERLKDRVFEQIFPHFAEGFIAHLCAEQGREAGDLSEDELQKVYRGTLTLLYRLLFLLYAESRDLLPVRETRGYWDVSLTRMKQEIGEQAGTILDETEGKLRRAYSATETALYERLQRLCRVVDKGERALNVPVYNGGLFITDPDPDDERTEAVTARFLRDNCIPDRHLALGLDLMARDLDDKTQALAFIDYKSLGVRQLGSIYEGLLEFKVRVARRNLCVVKEKGTYKYKPKGELTKTQREKLPKARATTVQEGPRKGDVYLENDKRERKATGSYYTPDYIVEYIVEHTVGPVLEEKFAELRPQLRRAETAYGANKSRIGVVEGYSREEAGREAYEAHKDVVEDLFDVKVLDPAMGSGHFLVETVDFLTDRLIDFLNAFPWNPVRELLEQTRRTIQEEMDDQEVNIDPGRLTDVNLLKRHVLKRCVYGVDLNPMAVELAKVSLWLDCFTLGAPLSFLDHHLRCGNSLVGTDVEAVQKAVSRQRAAGQDHINLFGNIFTGLDKATEAMAHVGQLTDTTVKQVHDSVKHYRTAQKLLAPYKRMLDVWVSQWFGNEEALDVFQLYADHLRKAVTAAVRAEGRPEDVSVDIWDVVLDALKVAEERQVFHWELEFPGAWPRDDEGEIVEEQAGFDAIVGNPPYVRQEALTEEKPYLKAQYSDTYVSTADIYVAFLEREVLLLRPGGRMGMIVANKWLRSKYGEHLRNFLRRETHPVSMLDFGHTPIFPDADTFPVVPVLKRRAEPLDGEPPDDETSVVVTMPRSQHQQDMELTTYVAEHRQALPTRLLQADGWSLADPRIQAIMEKMRERGVPLRNYCGCSPIYGVKTGCNEAFYIDETTRRRLLSEDPASAEIIKPLLRGRDIARWRVRETDEYIIFTRRGIDITQYPAIREHLAQFRGSLESRAGDQAWYELQGSPGEEFEKLIKEPKIVYQEIQYHSWYALDTSGAAMNNKVFFIPRDDLFLLGVLASATMWGYLTRTLPHMKDEALHPAGFMMEQIPIAEPSEHLRTSIGEAVEELIETARALHRLASTEGSDGGDALVAKLGHQLDLEVRLTELVEDAYGLTEDERRLWRENAPIRDPLAVLDARIRTMQAEAR